MRVVVLLCSLLMAVTAKKARTNVPTFEVDPFTTFLTLQAKVTEKVFFDIEVEGKPLGRIIFGLFRDVAPKTVENFVQLSEGTAGIGKYGKPLHYLGNHFHRIIPGFML